MLPRAIRGKIPVVLDGWLVCPSCGNKRLLKVRADTECLNLVVYCRKCKQEFLVNIVKGQSF